MLLITNESTLFIKPSPAGLKIGSTEYELIELLCAWDKKRKSSGLLEEKKVKCQCEYNQRKSVIFVD